VTPKINYTSTDFEVKGNKWQVIVASGALNYVQVLKLTNNPFLTTGRMFKNFDEAVRSYTSPEMKTALLKAELGIA
jgi:hypothetical protein